MGSSAKPLFQPHVEVLLAAVQELSRAPHSARAAIVERAAAAMACSVQTAYRRLRSAGFESGRKRRTDAGSTQMPDQELNRVAAVLLASLNKKGQRMPVGTALDMLHASGQLSQRWHESTVSRQLYQRRLHPEQMALPTPSILMSSRHPNHVWQIDSTTGAYYYLPGGRLRWMDEAEFYKNKPGNLAKASSALLTRYAAADHASHAFRCRYYLGGESEANLLDFVTWAMAKGDDSPMHGVPQHLIMDPGAANKGQMMRRFCLAAGINLMHHQAGAARVTGSVEKVHDLVRMHFETRFRFTDPSTVNLESLNATIQEWALAYCSTQPHSRHGMTRLDAWMKVSHYAGALRVASLDGLREAANYAPETRRVANDKSVSFAGRRYDLSLVPGVAVGLKVTLQVNLFRSPSIDVLWTCPDTGAETWHVVAPTETNEWGFPAGSPVWAEDHPQQARHSSVDQHRGELLKAAYALPTLKEAEAARKAHAPAFAGKVDPMADVHATQVPSYLPRKGAVLDLPRRQVQERQLAVVEMCQRLLARLGSAYSPHVYAELTAKYPDGSVPESHEDMLVQHYRPSAASQEPGAQWAGTQGGAA